MQVIQPALKIEEIDRKDSLLEILSDKYCITIHPFNLVFNYEVLNSV